MKSDFVQFCFLLLCLLVVGSGCYMLRRVERLQGPLFFSSLRSNDVDDDNHNDNKRLTYDLGLGKNRPMGKRRTGNVKLNNGDDVGLSNLQWQVAEPVQKPYSPHQVVTRKKPSPSVSSKMNSTTNPVTTRRLVARDEESQGLRNALWDETHFANGISAIHGTASPLPEPTSSDFIAEGKPLYPTVFYGDIDLSIPDSVFSNDGSVDVVWDLLRWEAYEQAQREPLLVSFLHSTILNHPSLESSLAFLLANRLQSPGMMISTQLQSLILDALHKSPVFRRSLRADLMAVRDRDPACNQLPDVFLYFKGFHALQSYRVAHAYWRSGKQVLAQFLQSQVSQIFQIDIHPNATLGSGMLVDHGTGVVIGSTASVGHNCSILHHVTLGGSGKKGVDRHPKVGDGVLLGAGATVLGPVLIGDGCQIGAGTLVISDLPAHSVAVGVPARIIGSFVDVTEQPSVEMNQMMDHRGDIITFESEGI